MNKFSYIQYTDAYYILEDGNKLKTKLPHNEAYGYVKKGKNKSLIVHFIKKAHKDDSSPGLIVKGLILPNNSISLNQGSNYTKELDALRKGQNVAVTWEDVVYVENDSRDSCSIMYTEGLVYQNNGDHLVILNPETIRTSPLPIKNHPRIKPLYYIIPKSVITKFEIINKST